MQQNIYGFLDTTTCILELIERIYCYQIKPNYLKNRKYFAALFFNFWNQN